MADVRARIAHISDLHFGAGLEPTTLAMLRQILVETAPDVLVVSGDLADQPRPGLMKEASRFLTALCSTLQLPQERLVVIPGNHDYKLWGNLGLRRLTRVPYHLYFEHEGLNKPWWGRLGQYLRLGASALWPRSQELSDRFEPHEYEDLGIAVAAFNSNSLAEMMAAGKVERESLRQFAEWATRRKAAVSFDLQFKIAVVHHHPAPIAFMPDGALGRLQESFMVFYNAGTFMYLVNSFGFHLVLHGHKHLAGLSRIGHPGRDGSDEVVVAAAGSAAHPHPDDSRGNHLNVIELLDDDTARLNSWFFSSEIRRREPESQIVIIQNLEAVRQWRYRVFRERHGYSLANLRKQVAITADGYSRVDMLLGGVSVCREGGLASVPLVLTTALPGYLRGLEVGNGPNSPPLLACKREETVCGLCCLCATLDFGRTYLPDRATFDLRYSFRLMNGHALSVPEFRRRYADLPLTAEYASVTCDEACDALELEVSFEASPDLATTIAASAEACYQPAPLRELEVELNNELKVHAAESRRAEGYLRREERRLVLRVPRPVPGFVYRIRWRFLETSSERRIPLAIETAVQAGKARLIAAIEGAVEVADDSRDQAYQRLALPLTVLEKELAVQLRLKRQERLALSLMIFDESCQKLRIVCANFGSLTELAKVRLVSGEGCAGFTFEKARPLLYHPSRDTIGYNIRAEEYARAKEGRGTLVDHRYLVSVPWFYPPPSSRRLEDQRMVVGVLNIGSDRIDSGLARLLDLGDADPQSQLAELTELQNLTAAWGAAMLSFVREEATS